MGIECLERVSSTPLLAPPEHLSTGSLSQASQVALLVKNLPANVGDAKNRWAQFLGSGRSPGGRHGNQLQYSCLENPMGRGAWWATVHRVTES